MYKNFVDKDFTISGKKKCKEWNLKDMKYGFTIRLVTCIDIISIYMYKEHEVEGRSLSLY